VTTVFVEAPARLHFGMLDLGGSLGRRFGGIGTGVTDLSVLVSATTATSLSVDTADSADAASVDKEVADDATRAARRAAERMLAYYTKDSTNDSTKDSGTRLRASDAARITLHRLIPPHQGLGSGTQLALATARAIAHIYDLPGDPPLLAHIVGRAARSAVGTYVFASGGLVVEGGRNEHDGRPAPLIARLPIPEDWRCVLILPEGRAGLSGDREVQAFAGLPTPPTSDAERVAHLVLMALLPALADGDHPAFGAALTEIQRINGRWFASQQGGCFAAGPTAGFVERLLSWGATGVGQSSWGPAVYAIEPDPASASALARRVRDSSPGTSVFECSFTKTGARTWDPSP
jgi:beta-ribofuranosylaminobenzene 5'-phosphate synthase